ncbi:MAG: leucyl aminopeptidase [Deltaproteobacteria bacterium]|nr:leucyl aminopeptidase [Deltaproteobacteria bacterium]
MMRLRWVDIEKNGVKNLIVPVTQDRELTDHPIIARLVEAAKGYPEFKGEKGDELILYRPDGFPVERVLFLGLGKSEAVNRETLRAFTGKGVQKGIGMKLEEAMFEVPSPKRLDRDPKEVLEPMLEGAFLANHRFTRYKKEKKERELARIAFLAPRSIQQQLRRLPESVETVCRGTLLAREWVSMPANEKRPEDFARAVMAEARKTGLKATLYTEKTLRQKGFNALLSVSAGSERQAQMVVLEHATVKTGKPVVLVGKGVTFDTGGINLKPGQGMDEMKTDMSGAAAVAATLIAASRLKMKRRLVGVLPIVENMPSGSAARPGDIVKSFFGKTVEIANTDAEGRLILIDAMAWAAKTYKPEFMIDLATLTGACVVALGEKIAGLFTEDEALAGAILESGERTFERCWRLPMPEDYKDLLKSDLADIRNVAESRWGGAIQGALFLAEFMEKTRWAHIDIAGPASAKKGGPYCSPGGTGFGVRLLCDILERV